jgi:RNA polymerase sigma-70 factor (ECF subfamily)
VTQETFMAVIGDAARYEPGRSSVVAWLLGIARNHARRRAVADRASDALSVDAMAPSLWVAPAQHGCIERDQELARLREALAALPVAYREAVVLCDLQELSYADAAVAAACAVGTVRSRLHRGRALLKEKMLRRDGARTARVPGWIA